MLERTKQIHVPQPSKVFHRGSRTDAACLSRRGIRVTPAKGFPWARYARLFECLLALYYADYASMYEGTAPKGGKNSRYERAFFAFIILVVRRRDTYMAGLWRKGK